MVEILAAGITGSVNSMDVDGLKLTEGEPHGLGQFYFIIDPDTHHSDFGARLVRLSDAVESQKGARLPGAKRVPMDKITVSEKLWQSVGLLGNGPC